MRFCVLILIFETLMELNLPPISSHFFLFTPAENKTKSFVMFLGDAKREHWIEMC